MRPAKPHAAGFDSRAGLSWCSTAGVCHGRSLLLLQSLPFRLALAARWRLAPPACPGGLMRRLWQNVLIWLALAIMAKDFVQQSGLPLIPLLDAGDRIQVWCRWRRFGWLGHSIK